MAYVGLLLAIPVGFALGLLGGGGSILAVPIFVYVLGMETPVAMAASLGVVGATSFMGAIPHARAGNLDLRAAGLFALGSVAGSWIGADIGLRTADVIRMMVFGAVMLAAAFMMLRGRKGGEEERNAAPVWLQILAGVGVGILIGFVGVGGGFMYVPALVFLVGLPMKRAVGTSLLIIGLSSVVGFARNIWNADVRESFVGAQIGDISLAWGLAIFLVLTIAGVWIGAGVAEKTEPAKLRRWFAFFLILMALYVLLREGIGF